MVSEREGTQVGLADHRDSLEGQPLSLPFLTALTNSLSIDSKSPISEDPILPPTLSTCERGKTQQGFQYWPDFGPYYVNMLEITAIQSIATGSINVYHSQAEAMRQLSV